MKAFLSLCFLSFGFAASAQELPLGSFALDCSQTRAGCPVLSEPLVKEFSGGFASFANVLFEKLPALETDGEFPRPFSVVHGVTVVNGYQFIVVACQQQPARVIWTTCTMTETPYLDGTTALTQIEFLNLLAQ